MLQCVRGKPSRSLVKNRLCHFEPVALARTGVIVSGESPERPNQAAINSQSVQVVKNLPSACAISAARTYLGVILVIGNSCGSGLPSEPSALPMNGMLLCQF